MATIQGTLTDGDGNGVADADVTITESGSGTVEAGTTTDHPPLSTRSPTPLAVPNPSSLSVRR